MNQNLQKHLKVYTGVAAAMLAHEKASGQINYVDVNPDTLIHAQPVNSGSHFFFLDIDGNTINDFKFEVYWASNNCLTCSSLSEHILVTPLNGNLIANKSYYHWNSHSGSSKLDPMKANSGDTIKYNLAIDWKSKPNQAMLFNWSANSGSFGGGGWTDFNNDYFLPFQLRKITDYFFGWIRIRTLSNHSLVIRDYAYNSIPNAPIIAGDTINASLSVYEINSGFSISQHNSNVLITSENLICNGTVKVFDLLGKEILSQNFSGHQTEINIDKKGIFIVEVSSDKSVIRKKVYVY